MATKSKMPSKKGEMHKNSQKRVQKRPLKSQKPVRLEEKMAKKQRSYISSAVIVLIVSVILGIFTYSPTTESIGVVGAYIHNCLFGLFAKSAYLLPFALFCVGIYVLKVKRTNKLSSKIIWTIIETVLLGALTMLVYKGEYPLISRLWSDGIEGCAGCGGVLGGLVAISLSKMIGRTASLIIVLALIATGLLALFNYFTDFRAMISARKEEKTEKVKGPASKTEKEPVFAGFDGQEVKAGGKKDGKEETEPQIDMGFLEGVAAQLPQTEGVKELLEEQKKKSKDKPKKAEMTTEEEKQEVKGEIEKTIEKPFANYVFPPISILNAVAGASQDKRREMYETANKLMTVLKNFGVEAKLLHVTPGPTVTRYEIQPSMGVKLSRISGLSEDIALNLAVPTVMVAAVPGKAAVGIEIPNNVIGTVSVRELLESEEFANAKSKLAVAFGKDIGGNVIIGDISKFPHVLIAGATGSGKSVCLNTIVASILYKVRPDDVKMIMIDPKVVELGMYNGIPHL
ncbi:MAG: DNA translocase FtsK, partial [Clostridia bacterium]|nr:DNA translocase FtsK [Clostridia bacterium]